MRSNGPPPPARRRFALAARALRDPVPGEKRALLAARWHELEARWRTPLQGLGRQSPGCGATIGLLPRCDFACAGCYLGTEANATPAASAREIRAQLRQLRRHLGPKGNVQLTDGEVTLLPEAELLAVVRAARRLGLIPMLMTHGDTLRRRPELLSRLVEAGLTEVAIHVDSLQRGRRGIYRAARSEAELEPLRDEMAELVRSARRQTGVRLRAAATLTVDRSNLAELPLVLHGLLRRRDVFGLVSLQPLAHVGRTRAGRAGVGADELWRVVGAALAPFGFDAARRGPLRFGHADCTRLEPMLAVEHRDEPLRLLPLVRAGEAEDEAIAARLLDAGLGGLAFRDDSPLVRAARTAGALAHAAGFVLGELLPWVQERLVAAGTTPARLGLDLARGRARIDSFQVVSHHFMDRAEIASARGRERLAACAFRVPLDGRMAPMCEVNALGLRERYYAELASRARPASAVVPALELAHRGSP